MKTFRRLMVALVVAVLAGTLGCNTVKGAGKDVESGGKSIQKAAEKVQNR